jgi:DNA-binding transcriptional LysR family regulator
MRGLAVRRLRRREHGAGTRAFVDAALRAGGVHPVEMLEALKRMAEVGVAAVPRLAVEREATAGCRRALELDAPATAWPTGGCGTRTSRRRPVWPSSAK